ncbi:MAG: asparagine synthase (glutamine-hydrolyzing) [Anaerolineae bacterium]|nr:asparagine synthase (glutamine-hydrolyzing) [Anaerolineae bacterium]
MCGICGVWYFDSARQVDPGLLRRMTDPIIHRGPDEDGYHCEGSVGLGFRRLSIIDVGGSHQPMPNEDERVWIVFNGEIYNFQQLRADLVARHTFRTVGDTETIIHAYEEYGTGVVNHLRGMFALALWDSRADSLTLAVDRFGKKPLYYLVDDEKVVFGSELKCLLQHPNVSRAIDHEALDEYLTFGCVTAPRSIFKQIRKVAPGHSLTIHRDRTIQHTAYWHPNLCAPEQYSQRSADDLAAELRELLIEAVRIRMISDVPLGAFLSGGVDSSAVVGIMSHLSERPVKTFSIGFDEQQYNETHYAQIVADYCHTDHTREIVRPDVIGILPKLIHQYDEPFADSSMIPTYYVSQVARKYVTVALSGDGGDEVFAGYFWYRYGFRHTLLQALIPASLRPTAAQVGRVIPRFTKLRPYLSVVDQPVIYWTMRTGFFNAIQRGQLYSADALRQLGAYEGERIKADAFARSIKLDWLSQMQYTDLTTYMPGDILVKVDRASMLASLEVRCPLLDHVVFEFLAHVPPQYRMTRYDSKILLKKALGAMLPPAIHHRPKWGFGIPLGAWLLGPLQPMMRDILLDQTTVERGLFNAESVARLVNEHASGAVNHEERLWALMCFELWAREYLDS